MNKTAKELVGSRIVAKIKLHNYRYPKAGHTSGNFAIVIFDVIRLIEGQIPSECEVKGFPGKYKITVTGELPKIDEKSEYVLQGVLHIDREWGPQYQPESLRLDYDLTREEDQRKFFSYFMTDRQVDMLFAGDQNPIDFLEQKNIGELTKIKGIGPATAVRMCTRYEESKNNSRAYVALKALDLSKRTIDRLISHYGSADIVVEKIESNPYILINEVKGIGWKKADDYAKRQGMANNCEERVVAYTRYYLGQQAEVNGNTWIDIDDLLTNVVAECQPITKEQVATWLKAYMLGAVDFEKYYARHLEGKENDEELTFLYYDKLTRRASLTELRVLEKDIATELHRLATAPSNLEYDKDLCEEIIADCEKEQGYKYTDEQKQAIWNVLDNNVTILTGSAGCVDCDTEFFTGYGWKKISEYKKGDKVLMYNEDGTATLVTPDNYIKQPEDNLWLVQSKYGVDMCVSDEHEIYYINNRGNLNHNTFANIKKMHEEAEVGFQGRLIASFQGDGPGIDLTDAEIKVMLAVICDGSLMKDGRCRFHLLKERKKVELRKILTEAGLIWKENPCSKPGYSNFYTTIPRLEKHFSKYWYNCSHRQLQLICDNVLQWDGCTLFNRLRFAASNKENIDFVQYAFTACGYRAAIKFLDRVGQPYMSHGKEYIHKSIDYTVCITPRNLVSITRKNPNKIDITPYKTLDGYKYCFTVPTHMWVSRRNGNILIQGNSGKSSTLKPLIRILEHYDQSIAQCALSGRASSLLSDYTGIEGKTIHRLLCFMPDTDRFRYTKYNSLPNDVVILDEASMVGGHLFLSLISAVASGSKFIMLGDTHQLESIGIANILKDCITSGYIKTITLTKIHRQAAMSGIITQSIQVSNGQSIVKNDFFGEEVRGELRDFKLIAKGEGLLIQQQIINEFKRLYYDCHVPLDDIQIIVPMKTRGDLSCRVLNYLIQGIVNPVKTNKDVTLNLVENGVKYSVCFRPNDKIIVVKNNYHAPGLDGQDKQIFNGNIGYIKDINEDIMIATIGDVGDIVLPRDQWDCIQHAYAITVHKKQGDSVPYAIIGLDTSAYALLSRELLYTAITRASKYCTLIVQPRAANIAVKTSRIKTKQTWLKDDLLKYAIEEGLST